MSRSANLQVSTPSDREIVMTREFNAPVALVWQAMSQPALLRRWVFAPAGWEMTACEEDPRPGGTFHWAWRGADGQGLTMRGEYLEVVPPTRVVRTEVFELPNGVKIGEQLATLELTAQGETTALRLTLQFDSKEARDGAIASGMENGVRTSYERLDNLLAEGKPNP